jgi:hypothetical protein
MMKSAIFAAILAVLLAGCAGMPTITGERQQVSSAHIGCAPAEIGIVNTGAATWEATCKAKVFYCTVAPSAACTAKM